jgi:pimeloyl-ACP methyl ester carboxylesterase
MTTDDSIIATLQALRDRPDRTEVLSKTAAPVLFIAGKDDTTIPLNKMEPLFALPAKSQVLVLDGVNHMGMFENYAETSQAIIDFTESCFA